MFAIYQMMLGWIGLENALILGETNDRQNPRPQPNPTKRPGANGYKYELGRFKLFFYSVRLALGCVVRWFHTIFIGFPAQQKWVIRKHPKNQSAWKWNSPSMGS